MIAVRARSELANALRGLREHGRRIALVPTMGALHEGHLALVRAARAAGAPRVVVSIFVNPLQFENDADLARYPVEHARDAEMLASEGVDLVWTPAVRDIYPDGHATAVRVGGPAARFEGEARPGHFDGVATVVSILFGAVRPDEAWFGEKDWQQLQVVRRLVTDLSLAVTIRALPTVRDASGLALSSRNRFLAPAAREAAPLVHRTLRRTASRLRAGDAPADAIAEAATAFAEADFVVDYIALVRSETMEPITTPESDARLITAVRLGTVRLLDNVGLD